MYPIEVIRGTATIRGLDDRLTAARLDREDVDIAYAAARTQFDPAATVVKTKQASGGVAKVLIGATDVEAFGEGIYKHAVISISASELKGRMSMPITASVTLPVIGDPISATIFERDKSGYKHHYVKWTFVIHPESYIVRVRLTPVVVSSLGLVPKTILASKSSTAASTVQPSFDVTSTPDDFSFSLGLYHVDEEL